MHELIRNLSDRTEFILVTGISFSYFVAGSLSVLLSGIRHVDLTTSRVVQAIFIELLILAVVALHPVVTRLATAATGPQDYERTTRAGFDDC